MSVSPLLIAKIARKLGAEFMEQVDLGKVDADHSLLPSEMQGAIGEMLGQGLISLGTNTEEEDFTAAFKIAKAAVRNIQRSTGGVLKVDGLLGEGVRKWLETRPFGHHPIRSLNESTTISSPSKTKTNTIRFCVMNNHLKKLNGLTESHARKLLNEAWFSWQEVCNVNVKGSAKTSLEQANVIIEVGVLKGQPKSVLAVADIGPPGKNQLQLKFDSTETWDAHRFQYTAAHEIGHLLGIGHLTAKDSLMNDTLHQKFKVPQSADKKKAASIWGPRA